MRFTRDMAAVVAIFGVMGGMYALIAWATGKR